MQKQVEQETKASVGRARKNFCLFFVCFLGGGVCVAVWWWRAYSKLRVLACTLVLGYACWCARNCQWVPALDLPPPFVQRWRRASSSSVWLSNSVPYAFVVLVIILLCRHPLCTQTDRQRDKEKRKKERGDCNQRFLRFPRNFFIMVVFAERSLSLSCWSLRAAACLGSSTAWPRGRPELGVCAAYQWLGFRRREDHPWQPFWRRQYS